MDASLQFQSSYLLYISFNQLQNFLRFYFWLYHNIPYSFNAGYFEYPLNTRSPKYPMNIQHPLKSIRIIYTNIISSEKPSVSAAVVLADADCWAACGKWIGLCEAVCGLEGYCCRKGKEGCPESFSFLTRKDKALCVRHMSADNPGRFM